MIMNYPKISIVTPSFNQVEFIEDTILSVISQNYPNLEYIIIDGGSTDGSVDIIKKYEKHLSYWVSESDNGHGHALNKGFSRTTGEIMAWINSDDRYYPYTFRTVAEIFNKFPDVNWIHGKNSWLDKAGRLKEVLITDMNIYSYLLLDYEWIQQESVFWRRTLWEKSGAFIDEELKLMVDGELWSRFFLTDEIWNLDTVIGGFRNHDNNRSHKNFEIVHSEMKEVINRMKNRLTLKQLSSFKILQQYRDLIITAKKKENALRNLKILKFLPHFLYNKVTRNFPRKKISLDIDFDTYCYKRLSYSDNEWIKQSQKFRYLE